MGEQERKWTPIPGWPQYAATRDGRIFSISHNWRGYGVRELSQRLNSYGYPSVRISRGDGTRKHLPVHRLIAATFLGPKPTADHEVRHLDGNKLNRHVSNLAWGTRKENAADRIAHGRQVHGHAINTAKLTVGDVLAIRAAANNTTCIALSQTYGTTPENVSQIVRRKTWRHV